MACSTTLLGAVLNCDGVLGGLKKVYIAPYTSVSGFTIDANEIVTGFTGVSAGTFKEYSFENAEASDATYSTTDTINLNQRLRLVKAEVVLNMNKLESVKRKEIEALATADLMLIVKDENDIYHLIGQDRAARMSAGTSQTGASRTEKNGYTVTFMAESKKLPYTVSSAAVSAVI